MGSTQQNLHIYNHFKSIWQAVDNNNITKLANHPDLAIKINNKEQGVTPLFLACMRRNFPVVHFLLQSGADPNIECKGVTALYLCCLYAEEDSVEQLLTFGADHSILCTSRKVAPLHLAASKGIMSLAQRLVRFGADVNIYSPKYGTPLHVAVSKNHQYIIQFLLSNGGQGSLNVAREDGDTPLHIACRSGFIPVVKTLLDQPGINATLKENQDGNTSLHTACLFNRETIALMLISKYPDLIYVKNNSDRQTPLFYAGDSVRKAIKNAFVNQMPGFQHLVNNKSFSDVHFTFPGDKHIYAHKVLLHFRCPSLSNKELQGKNNNNNSVIPVHDIDYAVFLAFINYLYTDKLVIDKLQAPKLITVADKYGILRLKKLCLDLTSNLMVEIPNSTFKSDMKGAVNNPLYSDVSFIVEGQTVNCHRALLAQHEYFRLMFGVGHTRLKESQQKEIPMLEVGFEVFMALMQYCYTFGIQEVKPDHAVELFQCASVFMLDGLRHTCEAYLCSCITKENVCQLFRLADDYKSLFLKEECFDYIIVFFGDLCDTEDYQSLSKELKEEINEYYEGLARAKKQKAQQPVKDQNFSLL